MAHFAKMNGDTVVEVVVVNNASAPDEATGIAFCKELFGADTEWVQTSYNASIRKNYAGIGFTYDAGRDAFIPPKPAPDYIFREKICRWMHPSWPGEPYEWNEAQQGWVLP